jgi:dynein heavy chain
MKFQDQAAKERASLFDFFYDKQRNLWLPWVATQPQYQVTKEMAFHELIVPTSDLVRNSFFLHLCVRSRVHLLLAGPTGTGKTVNLVNEINSTYFTKDFTNLQATFSGQTTANAL